MDKEELKSNIGDVISKIIRGEITYEEIGYSYDDLRMIIPKGFRKGALVLLERRYKEEQLKKEFEKVPEERLRRQLVEEQEDLRYLETYLDLIERFFYRIDFEKMKRKIPVDKLYLLRGDIANAESKSITYSSKQHPLYGMLIDSKDRKKWDLMSAEDRVTRIKSLINEKCTRINYISKILDKLQEINPEKMDSDEKGETQTAELEKLKQQSDTLDKQIQAAEALEVELTRQNNEPTPSQGDGEAK